MAKKKIDPVISIAGSVQNVVVKLATRVEERGGSLTEALMRLGKPENEATLDQMADILAGVCQKVEAPPVPPPILRTRTLSPTVIEVNLDAPPVLPFAGAEVVSSTGKGWVNLEKRADGLYVGEVKVVLYLSKRQQDGKVIKGHKLREELSGKVLHSNVMDALYDNPHLIPEEWKLDEQGRTRYIYFWGTIYRGAGGRLCVRYLCWSGGAWDRDCDWLGHGWGDRDPAAVPAS